MMEHEIIIDRLVAIHTALVEKTGEQPWIGPDLNISQDGKCSITLYRKYMANGEYLISTVTAEGVMEALDATDEYIVNMPDPEEARKLDFHKDLGSLIDRGNDIGIDASVMTPLTATMNAMSENLLTHKPECG